MNVLKSSLVVSESASRTIGTESPWVEWNTVLVFIFIEQWLLMIKLLLAMSKLTFIAVSARTFWDPIFAHLSFVKGLILFELYRHLYAVLNLEELSLLWVLRVIVCWILIILLVLLGVNVLLTLVNLGLKVWVLVRSTIILLNLGILMIIEVLLLLVTGNESVTI